MRTRALLPPLVLGCVGMVLAFHPMLGSGLAAMQADAADTRHLNYVLEHGHRWLAGGADAVELWSPRFFHPQQGVAGYTELLLGVLPFYSAFRVLGFEPDTSFQLWMLLVGALNYLAAYLFLKGPLKLGGWPGAVGAFLFAFGSARLCQLNHQHLLAHFLTITALHGLARLFGDEPAARPRFWLGVVVASGVLQLYAGYQYGWFLGFSLLLALGWALAFRATRARLQRLLPRWKAVLVTAALGAIALLPLALPYLRAAEATGYRGFHEVVEMLPRLQSWFFLGAESVLYRWLMNLHAFASLPMGWEHRIGLGLVTTATVFAVSIRYRQEPWVRVLALTTLTVVLLVTMYRGRVSPWQLVFEHVPGANAIRAVSRVGILLLVPAAVLVACALERLEQAGRRWGAVALGALVVLEQGQYPLDRYDKQATRERVAAIAERVPRECRAFFYAPVGSAFGYEVTQLDAMWVGLMRERPTVNGYSSNFPRGWELGPHNLGSPEVDRPPLQERLARWLALHGLSREDVCWVEGP